MIKNSGVTGFKPQSGFTLIEIAIVLVIVGLLIGGVLQGQQLIENSRVRNAISDINGVSAAINGYRDRFGRTPGDDGPLAVLQARGGNWAQITLASTAPNGVLAATAAQTFAPTLEANAFWQHLRASGFIPGDPAAVGAAALRSNAFGGLVGVSSADIYQTNGAGTGLAGIKVCLNGVPGNAAASIDRQMDDGRPGTGRMRASIGGAPVAAALPAGDAYAGASTYTVCSEN